jgi:hypothetical protein
MQGSFLPIVFWLGLPQLTWRLVVLVRERRAFLECTGTKGMTLGGSSASHYRDKMHVCLTRLRFLEFVLQMAMCLYVGNAIKDLVCAPRPLQVAYGREKLRFLGRRSSEDEMNSKVCHQQAHQATLPGCQGAR